MEIIEFLCDNLPGGHVTDCAPVFRFAVKAEGDVTAAVEVDGNTMAIEPGVPVKYSGALFPYKKYIATLTVRGDGDVATRSVEFETGKLGEPWKGVFITDGTYRFKGKHDSPKPLTFKRYISLKKELTRATVYATAIGVYELAVNGKKVGDRYFAPGFTSYKNSLYYQTYDVTEQLVGGGELTACVAGGWAVGSYIYTRINKVTAKRQAFLCEVRLEYADGTVEVIGTDESWEVTQVSPYIEADLYDGEDYDSRISPDKTDWKNAAVERVKISPVISADIGLPVRRHERLLPVKVSKVGEELIYDFGQNLAGIVELKLNGRAGQVVTVKHAEILDPDGTLNTVMLRSAKARIQYTCRDGEQVYSPRFTYMGYRYISIEGIDEQDVEAVTYALYSDLPEIGCFECSDALVNKLAQNLVWSAKSNFVEIPTDCPQRDERMGWTGDIAMFAPTACYNFDMSRFFDKWLRDMRAEQLSTGGFNFTVPVQGYGFPTTMPSMAMDFWGDACILVPYAEYLARGDKRILEEMYPSMKKYVKACAFWASIGLGKRRYIWHTPHFFHFGDWVSPDVPKLSQWQKRSGWTATASLYNTSSTLAKIADILGYGEDAERYKNYAAKVADAYESVFTDGKGRLKKEFQTAYVLPLAFGMFGSDTAALAAENLARLVRENDYCIGTGIPGSPYVLFALCDSGHSDVAYKMLLNTKCPSWLYEVKAGATTVWERWDGLNEDGVCTLADNGVKQMVSYNHYVFGSVGAFLYRRVLGLEPTDAGYREFTVRPVIGGGLTYAKGKTRTPYGTIACGWRTDGEKVTVDVTVPYGTKCRIVLPSGKTFELGHGTHTVDGAI